MEIKFNSMEKNLIFKSKEKKFIQKVIWQKRIFCEKNRRPGN